MIHLTDSKVLRRTLIKPPVSVAGKHIRRDKFRNGRLDPCIFVNPILCHDHHSRHARFTKNNQQATKLYNPSLNFKVLMFGNKRCNEC